MKNKNFFFFLKGIIFTVLFTVVPRVLGLGAQLSPAILETLSVAEAQARQAQELVVGYDDFYYKRRNRQITI